MMKLNLLPDYKQLMGYPPDVVDQGEYVEPRRIPIASRFIRCFHRAHTTAIISIKQGGWMVLTVIGSAPYLNGYYLSRVKGYADFKEN